MPGINNWSFSTLMKYEQCPMRVKLEKIDRAPEPPPKPDSPLERGNREHSRYERFVKGDAAALDGAEAKSFADFLPLLQHARELCESGMVEAEENWLFDENWEPCDREKVWLWTKVDLNVQDPDNGVTVVVDYKTGKSAYKALEHVQQMQLYAAVAALRQELAAKVIVELWYVDEGWCKQLSYTRDQALSYVGRFQSRASALMEDKYFRPNPNIHNCRFCPYSPRGTGACPVGV